MFVYQLLYACILTGKQKLLPLCLIGAFLTTSLRATQKLIGTTASLTIMNTWRTTKRKMATMIMIIKPPLAVTKVIILMMTTNQSK